MTHRRNRHRTPCDCVIDFTIGAVLLGGLVVASPVIVVMAFAEWRGWSR